MEIVILFALIALNGLFAMSEIALVTARKPRLQKLLDEGDRSAVAAVNLGEDRTPAMAAILSAVETPTLGVVGCQRQGRTRTAARTIGLARRGVFWSAPWSGCGLLHDHRPSSWSRRAR